MGYTHLCHICSLKSAMVAVFTSWKSTNTTNRAFFFQGSHLNIYQHIQEPNVEAKRVLEIANSTATANNKGSGRDCGNYRLYAPLGAEAGQVKTSYKTT